MYVQNEGQEENRMCPTHSKYEIYHHTIEMAGV